MSQDNIAELLGQDPGEPPVWDCPDCDHAYETRYDLFIHLKYRHGYEI